MRSVAGRTGLYVLVAALLSIWVVGAVIDARVEHVVTAQIERGMLEWLAERRGLFSSPDMTVLDYLSQFDGSLDEWQITQLDYYDAHGLLHPLWSLSSSQTLTVESYELTVAGERLKVTIASPILEVYGEVRTAVSRLLTVAAVGLCMFTALVVSFELRPLRRLASVGSGLLAGQFDRHIEISGPREVQHMARVLEEMRLRFRQLVGGAITHAMIWEGNLELYPLSMLLMMLRFTRQTGMLAIMSRSDLGLVYVQNGNIRGAAFREYRGRRAFYALFLLEEGTFKFNPKMKPLEDELQTLSWHAVLLYAARRVHSLRFIEQYVPDFRYVAKKSQHGFDEEQVRLDLTADELYLWEAIDDQRTVTQYARDLGWTPERVQRYLYRFAVVGLIESSISDVGLNPPPANVVSLWARAAWRRGE
ncbi:MAG: DUF4388 domain-containing protein [Limnochordia bacterium]|nr:MAG: hypothetical protein AA931_05320 [Peptococcaceae bacterium 1109]